MPATPAKPLSCLCGLQEVFQQSMACSFVGNHKAVYRQWQPNQNHRMPRQQGDQCSLPWQQHRRMILNHNWSAPKMSALPHPLQHLFGENNGWHTWRPWRNSIGCRTITNLRFADDIDALAGQEWELVKLVSHLEEAYMAYGMQISGEKTQFMIKSTNGISTNITIDNKKL